MSNRELQLISRIVRTGDLQTVIEWGITTDDFLTNEGLAMWNHINGYFTRPDTVGSVFGPNVFRAFYPTFILCDDEGMMTDALCAEVRNNRVAVDVNVICQKALELAGTDPGAAMTFLNDRSTEGIQLSTSQQTDIFFGDSFEDILRRYELRKAGVDLSVCPLPWQPLNDEIGGLDPVEYMILYGRPKSMKSWVLAFLICWFYWHDKKVLIYTKEMTAENIFMRVAACIAQIEYHGLRMGTLSPDQELELYSARNAMRDLRMQKNLVCLSGQDAPKGMDTVAWIRAKIEHHRPDIAAIDGMYLLSDGKKGRSREERITNISRDMRQMILSCAKSKRPCPVIATFQATRGAAQHGRGELDEIAYSDAIGQDTTMAFRVINDVKTPTISMILAGAREFDLNGFRIHGVPATNFGLHSLLTAKDIERAKENDTGDADNAKAHAKKNNSDPRNNENLRSATRSMKDRVK